MSSHEDENYCFLTDLFAYIFTLASTHRACKGLSSRSTAVTAGCITHPHKHQKLLRTQCKKQSLGGVQLSPGCAGSGPISLSSPEPEALAQSRSLLLPLNRSLRTLNFIPSFPSQALSLALSSAVAHLSALLFKTLWNPKYSKPRAQQEK